MSEIICTKGQNHTNKFKKSTIFQKWGPLQGGILSGLWKFPGARRGHTTLREGRGDCGIGREQTASCPSDNNKHQLLYAHRPMLSGKD